MNPTIRRLWRTSKIYKVPLFDPLIAQFNIYDLELMDYLTYFEDPENLKEYKGSYIDDEFDEYWNNPGNSDFGDYNENENEDIGREVFEKIYNEDGWEEVDE